MIDWFNLFANALWIAALALVLAVLSYASWSAGVRGSSLLDTLALRGPQSWLNLAGLLFSSGLFLTTPPGILKYFWLIPAGYFLWSLFAALFLNPRNPKG